MIYLGDEKVKKPEATKIKVKLPATFCAGREERVRVKAKGENVTNRIRAKLSQKGQSKSEAVAMTHNKKDGSCFLFVKPREEGEHSLSVTIGGQHIPNSPFLLSVNNRDYYRTTFVKPVQTVDIRSPYCIAFSSNGDMFVTSASTHSIHIYDNDSHKKKEIGKQGKGNLEFDLPNGIAIRGDVLFVADGNNHRVQKLSTEGMFLSTLGTQGSGDGKLNCPTGLTIGPDGMLYVSDFFNDRVVVFSEADVFVRNIDVSPTIRGPWGLSVSSDGNLHVAGYESNNYAVFSSAGKLVRSLEFACSTDVAIDAAGYVFAVHYTNEKNSLSVFNAQGLVVHTIKLDHPWGVAIAPDGSVCVAGHRPNKLWKF